MKKRPTYYPIDPEHLYDMFTSTNDKLTRAICCLTYVTGARISETAKVKASHITIRDKFYHITMKVSKKRIDRRRTVLVPRGKKAKCLEDKMMKEVFDYLKGSTEKGQPFWIWGLPDIDNPKGHPEYMSTYIRRNINLTTEASVRTKGVWWDKEITKPLHPHYLRHCRAGHLVQYYDFNDTRLRLFFDWSDSNMAAKYTHVKDLSDAFG